MLTTDYALENSGQKFQNMEENKYIALLNLIYHLTCIEYELGSTEKQKKQKKQSLYKDLIERNPFLTIYKQQQELAELLQQMEENLSAQSTQILNLDQQSYFQQQRNIVTWLYNKQQTLKVKDERDKLQEKVLLKHILTYDQKIPQTVVPQLSSLYLQTLRDYNVFGNDAVTDFVKIFYTLYHYINEAVDKQQEGIINNAMMLIQPQNRLIENQYVNYFAQAIGYQIWNINKSQKDGVGRSNRVVFINLVGRESKVNLKLWNSQVEKNEDCQYYSFIKVDDANLENHKQEYQDYYQQMLTNSKSKISLIPFYCKESVLNFRLFQVLFEDFVQKNIQKSSPSYIALSLGLSEFLTYDKQLIEYVVKHLSALTSNKLILHCCFENENIIQQKQILNRCYTSFSGTIFKILDFNQYHDQHQHQTNPIQLYCLLKSTQHIYEKIRLRKHSDHLKTHLPHIQFTINDMNLLSQQSETIQPYMQNIFQLNNLILYKKRNVTKVIEIELESGHIITQQTEIKIYYKENIILIYDNQSYLYYQDVSFILNENQDKNINIPIRFQKVDLSDSFSISEYQQAKINQLSNPVIFFRSQYIYLIYGTYTTNQQTILNSRLLRFDIKQKKWKMLPQKINCFPQVHFSGKTGYDQSGVDTKTKQWTKEYQDYLEKVKQERVSPTVCINEGHPEAEQFSVILFNGENQKQPDIMNFIEQLEIDDYNYCTGKVDKSQIYKGGSVTVKPYPHQIVLHCQTNGNSYYLYLPGNDSYRKEKYNFPVNTQFTKNATLIKSNITEIKLSEYQIEYLGPNSINISDISNKYQNQQFIFGDGQLLVWRVITVCTQNRNELKRKSVNFSYPNYQDIEVSTDQESVQSYQYVKQFANNDFPQTYSDLDIIVAYCKEFQSLFRSSEDEIEKIQKQMASGRDERANKFELVETKKKVRDKLLPILENVDEQEQQMEIERSQNVPEKIKQIKKKQFHVTDQEITTVAFENYIFLNIQESRLQIKQYLYDLREPISLPKQDISSKNYLAPVNSEQKTQGIQQVMKPQGIEQEMNSRGQQEIKVQGIQQENFAKKKVDN